MKQVKNENYLERVPKKNPAFRFTKDDKDLITIEIDNKGFFNRVLQLLIKKPRITYVHLDEFASFVFDNIDGKKNIIEIGKDVKERFGEQAEPLYQRLAQFIAILESRKFCIF